LEKEVLIRIEKHEGNRGMLDFDVIFFEKEKWNLEETEHSYVLRRKKEV